MTRSEKRRAAGHAHEKRRLLARASELPRVARVSAYAAGLEQGQAMSGHLARELRAACKELNALDDELQQQLCGRVWHCSREHREQSGCRGHGVAHWIQLQGPVGVCAGVDGYERVQSLA